MFKTAAFSAGAGAGASEGVAEMEEGETTGPGT